MLDQRERTINHPQPSGRRSPAAMQALREVAITLVVTGAYFLTRGLIRGKAHAAIAHATALLALERRLHIAPEQRLQAFALHHLLLVHAADTVYLAAHLPVLIGVAIWLYHWRSRAYRFFRTAFLCSALIGLSVYVLYPVTPPRFLPGFVDTMQRYGFNVDGSVVGPFYNPYAAVPSLHVAWALLAGVAVAACARPFWVRILGVLLPVVMVLAVVVTGNHFLLDVLSGCAVTAIALLLAHWWSIIRQKGEVVANQDRESARSPRTGWRPHRASWPSFPAELRILLPAAQLLMGFLLVIPFTNQFARLRLHERGVYLAAAIAAANSILLFAAVFALPWIDRMFRHGMPTPGAVRRVVATGRIALASAVILTSDLVGNGVGGDGFGIIAALLAAFLIAVAAIDRSPTDDDDAWCP